WQGHTHEEAARLLGCPLGTVRSRVARGREMLRAWLSRRGLALPSATLVIALVAGAAPAPPGALLAATAGAGPSPGKTMTAGPIPPRVRTLVEGGLRGTASLSRAATLAALLLAGTLAVTALAATGGEGPPPAVPKAAGRQPTAESRKTKTDLFGDPL